MAAQVQKVAATINAAATVTMTLPNAVTAGNTIIAKVTAYDPGSAVSWTVTDNRNAGNFNQDAYVSRVISGSQTANCGIYHRDNTAASVGASSFTATFHFTNGSGGAIASVEEVSGLNSTSSLDQTGTNSDVSTTSSANVSASAPNAAPSGYGAACMTLFTGDNPSSIALASPWVNDGVEQNGAVNAPGSSDHKVISAAETTSASYTHVHTTQAGWAAAVATYKDAAVAYVPDLVTAKAQMNALLVN